MSQVTSILQSNRTFTDTTWSSTDESLFLDGSKYGGVVTLPPETGTTNFWGGGHIVNSSGAANERPLINIGKILEVSDPTTGTALYYIDPNIPANASDPLKGKRVFRYDLDVLSRATAADKSGGGDLTEYMQQTYTVRAVPLFTNAVYYNMDMEVQPGPDLNVTGSTHTNGRLFVRSASNSPAKIQFAGPVTAVKGIWTNFHTNSPSTDNIMPYFQSITDSGSLQTNASTGLINILKFGTTSFFPMCLTAPTSGFTPQLPTGTWVESTWDLHPTGETWQRHLSINGPFTETPTTLKNFKDWCQGTFGGNLLTNADGLLPNNIPGIPDYSYVYGSLYPDPGSGTTDAAYTYMTSTGNDLPNAAHALIETPRLVGAASYLKPSEDIKYSRYASLYIVANTTGVTATGHQPDGSTINVGAKSYRAFMNDGAGGTPVEVILPGQDTFGDSNLTSNPYTTHKNARPVVQMMNIDFATNLERANQRRMTDIRRTGAFDQTLARSATNPYDPKNLFMIDIDMTELKKAVRTMTIAVGTTVNTTDTAFYQTGAPTTYANYIYNPAATGTNVTLNDTTRIITTNVTTLTNAFTTTIWNGAVYVESIAADSFDRVGATAAIRRKNTHQMRNSGVRLINGRGKVPSPDGVMGFTFATNDAVYVLGSFNTDGLSSTPATVAVNVPAAPGASTGHNYEPGELPASIVGDAIYLLSQPNYNTSTTQNAGWNDAFSALTENASSGNWKAAWATIPPDNKNTHDGDLKTASSGTPDGVYPYVVPYDSDSGSGSTGGTTLKPNGSSNQKLAASFSEYSFAMLCGLVPTGKNGITQTSGGLHNFPRFLESWGSVDCRIRGAMVALFECRVANDTWNLRTYGPPNRVWGFNLLFDQGIMPPLTPKTIEIKRAYENDITKAAYNAKLTAWGYPTLP
ncbi:MAG: hypothetical protein ABI273_05960 [Lacunisphaera sp.]